MDYQQEPLSNDCCPVCGQRADPAWVKQMHYYIADHFLEAFGVGIALTAAEILDCDHDRADALKDFAYGIATEDDELVEALEEYLAERCGEILSSGNVLVRYADSSPARYQVLATAGESAVEWSQ